MNFFQSIASVARNYFGFDGRASRSEFWHWVLFRYGVIFVIVVLIIMRAYAQGYHDGLAASLASPYIWSDGNTVLVDNRPPFGTLALIFLALTFFPNAAVSIRRLHDIGRSGWWFVALHFIPLGEILLFVFYLQRSSPGLNRYDDGPNPLIRPAHRNSPFSQA
ncbi:DUF805 domain-containing protein [uncultured Maricaulis sp.]|uniref:DUF805 domain-containing protein n=1 Tax=uncultured Maricaulis sp. TaxID=174710 RepID=UPI0030DD5FB4|tara:strand:- start:141790 stop:142278 length:489 start_codon:yes stop_codon:yes gene_type:complete